MSIRDRLTDYPQRIRLSARRLDLFYLRRTDCYAVHNRDTGAQARDAMLLLDEGRIAVFAGDSTEALPAPAVLSPVYALQGNGPPAVPTGLVYLRFAEGIEVKKRQRELERAGYEIKRIPPYAPHTAWLCARSGGIAAALNAIPALEALPEVENVEPQMLLESARRS